MATAELIDVGQRRSHAGHLRPPTLGPGARIHPDDPVGHPAQSGHPPTQILCPVGVPAIRHDHDGRPPHRVRPSGAGQEPAEVGGDPGATETVGGLVTETIDHGSGAHTTVLPASVVSAVTTSHVGRRQGLASSLTARAVALGAADGAAVSLLGMFEQGFYNRFGFATGSPVPITTFDPSSLLLGDRRARRPTRLGLDDGAAMSAAMRRRLGHHGRVTLDAPEVMRAEFGFSEQPFALGYRDGDRITHFLAGNLKDENGPFEITACSYENGEQLLELLALLHELGDQVHSVELPEPAHLQLHPLVAEPNRQRNRSRRGAHESGTRAVTWWQLRVNDVPAVVAAHRWVGVPVEFDLEVADPIDEVLPGDRYGWAGTTGSYRVRLGTESRAERIDRSGAGSLPVLRAGIGAFSRLWFGVQPASALALVGELEGPPGLLAALDDALLLPTPTPGQFF